MGYIHTIDIDSLRSLLNAVVLQAAKDYREAATEFKTTTNEYRKFKAAEMMEDCEEFFLSERFRYFTKLSGKKIYERLKSETIEQSVTTGGISYE